MPDELGQVTVLLTRMRRGDRQAADQLVPLVMDELRRLARHYLSDERTGHTLQPTALVHEAYLKMAGYQNLNWESRSHFIGVAAGLMRQILIDSCPSAPGGQAWPGIREGFARRAPGLSSGGAFGGVAGTRRSAPSSREDESTAEPNCRIEIFWRPLGGRNRQSARRVSDHRETGLGNCPSLAARGARITQVKRRRAVTRQAVVEVVKS